MSKPAAVPGNVAAQPRQATGPQNADAGGPARTQRQRLRTLIRPARGPLAALLAILLLALIFLAYLRPDFAFDLANRFILCL